MTATPYRVLYLNHGAKPSGAEFSLWRLTGAIDRQKVRPTVLYGEEGLAEEMVRQNGVETHILSLTKKVRDIRKDRLHLGAFMHVGRLLAFSLYAAQIARFARRHRIQIIHTNTLKAHIYGALAGRLAGIPVVWHVRDCIDENYLPSGAVKIVRFLARHAPTHVIGVSQAVLHQLQLGPRAAVATVIHGGLSDQELTIAANAIPSAGPTTPVRIGIVGRLSPWKGQHVFLDAAARIIKAGFDARFCIIGAPLFGEETYETKLRQQAERLGIDSRVEFKGFIRDVVGELRNLDILVHASTTGEPFGQVILEGMSVGLPVVASRGGGVPEIISHGENGLLTTMGNSEELAEAVVTLLRDPALAKRLGDAGFEHVRKYFRAARVARQVEGVYDLIMG